MLDRKLVKSVATETLLMMGKSIPVAGKGIELWQAVSAQRERAGNAEQIAELEARLSRFERKQQALAAETMQQVLAELRSDASHQARHDALQDLHDMKQAGYLVGAFEGLIQRSPHYQSIQRTPQAFGKLLEPGDTLDPTAVPIFVSFDGKPRILQVPLFTLENLLAPINNAQTLTAGSDVWGLPTTTASSHATEVVQRPEQGVLASSRPVLGTRSRVVRSQPQAGTIQPINVPGYGVLKMVSIPPGTFWMGAKDDDGDAEDYEKPRHQVCLPRGFQMGQTQVTQALYEAITGGNPSSNKTSGEHPVDSVTWIDAVRFCNALSAACGLEKAYMEKPFKYFLFDGSSVSCNFDVHGFRLPTEAEWEYAAKAGQDFKYSGSNDLETVAWYRENSQNRTQPVAQKKPNAWGLYDMSGNVWEWCWDWFDLNEYENRVTLSGDKMTVVHSPKGAKKTCYVNRVKRGGSAWWPERRRFFNSARSWHIDGLGISHNGLRVVLSSPYQD